MRRLRRFGLSLLMLWLLASRAAGAAGVAAQVAPAGEMLALVNQFRASVGLPAFEGNGQLAAAAQNHANWMASTGLYSHTGAGGSSPLSRATAAGYNGYVTENIVGGTGLTPQKGLIWWQNSPVHYNTLVSTRHVHAGVGFATDGSQNFYVLVVGQPSNRPAAPPEAASEPQGEPLVVRPIELAQPRDDGSIVHVVQEGQAVWSLAAHYEVDLAHILLINGLDQSALVHPGDEIVIRLAEGQPPPPTPTPPLTHIVRSGETPWTIAAIHGIDLALLYYLNNLSDSAILQPGDELRIRLAEGEPPPPTPTPQLTHVVRSGETAWSIAATYSLELDQLLAWNGLGPDPMLHPGDELWIREPATPTPLPTDTPNAPANATPASFVAQTPLSESATSPVAPSLAGIAEAAPILLSSPTPSAATTDIAGDLGTLGDSSTIALLAGIGLAALLSSAYIALKRRLSA